jgi:uncharacterized protein
MSFEYWYMLPVSILIAILANSSGFSGGVLFQPIFNLVLKIPVQNSIATGIATETLGMTSGAIRYLFYKMVELPVGFMMIIFTIPGIILSKLALSFVNGDLLKLVLGIIIFGVATVQLLNALKKTFGKKINVSYKNLFPYIWIAPIAGLFSATTGTGIAELSQPVFEKGLDIKTKRANATAILVEAVCDWVITVINLNAGLIIWEIWIFSGIGVIIGGQIGPYVSRFMPDKIVKIIFSSAIIIIGIFYIFKGIDWILK